MSRKFLKNLFLVILMALPFAAGANPVIFRKNLGETSTVTVPNDETAPSGYAVAFASGTILAAGKNNVTLNLTGLEVGATFNWVITNSADSNTRSGSGTVSSASRNITGINLFSPTNFADGVLTASLTLTDSNGNVGNTVTSTATLETNFNPGTVAFTPLVINNANKAAVAFAFAGAPVGASCSYSISSSGSSGGVGATTDTLASAPCPSAIGSPNQSMSPIDVTTLYDGTLTLSVVVTASNGNVSSPLVATIVKDTVVPTGYAVAFASGTINAAGKNSVTLNLSGLEVGATFNYTLSTSGNGNTRTGSGTVSSASQSVTGINLSSPTSFADGMLTASLTLTDSNGNIGSAVTGTATLETNFNPGTVAFTPLVINNANKAVAAFAFTGAPVGASCSYSISSSGGSGGVGATTDTLASAPCPSAIGSPNQSMSPIDVTTLYDGTLTLSVVVTASNGNVASPLVATIVKDTVAPTISSTLGYASPTILASGGTLVFDAIFSEAVTLSNIQNNGPTMGIDINGTARVTSSVPQYSIQTVPTFTYQSLPASGSQSNIRRLRYQYTVQNGDSASLGQISLRAASGLGLIGSPALTMTDAAGNPYNAFASNITIANVAIDTVAPTGYAVAFANGSINATGKNNVTLNLSGLEVGASFSYTISTSGNGNTRTGSGTVSSASQSVTGINLSSPTNLADGTLTASLILTDSNGNVGSAVTGTAVLDTVAPRPTAILTSAANAASPNEVTNAVSPGANLVVTVTFNEAVTASSGATITLPIGTTGTQSTQTFTLSSSPTTATSHNFTLNVPDSLSHYSSFLDLPTGTTITAISDAGGNAATGPSSQLQTATRVTIAARSCKTLKDGPHTITSNGTFVIDPDQTGSVAPFIAFCDMTSDGGGWTLVAKNAANGSGEYINRGTFTTGSANSNGYTTGNLLSSTSVNGGRFSSVVMNETFRAAGQYNMRYSIDGTPIVFMKRMTNQTSWDFAAAIFTWSSANTGATVNDVTNNTSFDTNTNLRMHSTISALNGNTGRWTFCNTEPTVGFLRDCGPTGYIANRWFTHDSINPGGAGTLRTVWVQ